MQKDIDFLNSEIGSHRKVIKELLSELEFTLKYNRPRHTRKKKKQWLKFKEDFTYLSSKIDNLHKLLNRREMMKPNKT